MVALLIRHAVVPAQDVLGERATLALNSAGEQQALRLAERLQDVKLAAIFSSPILRAMQTARAIAKHRDIPVIADHALREVNAGEWENRRFSELAAIETWRNFQTFRSGTRTPGGEMMIEVQARAVGFLERITREYANGVVAIVSHADVIRSAVCHYIGIPLDLSLRVQLRPASVTTLHISECGAELIELSCGEWDVHSSD